MRRNDALGAVPFAAAARHALAALVPARERAEALRREAAAAAASVDMELPDGLLTRG